jgi:MarR family 2-MHQ and catechol resistance regulon transcriptional repressor
VEYATRYQVLYDGQLESRREASELVTRVPHRSREVATHVWLVLWKAAHAVEQNARRSVAALGLGRSDFAVLEVLLHKGPQPVNIIGGKVLLTSGSITAAVDRLESRKLIRRTSNPKDGRSRIVRLTETGRHLIERAFRKHALDMEETMAVLRTAERAELLRLLKKIGMWAAARLDHGPDRQDSAD